MTFIESEQIYRTEDAEVGEVSSVGTQGIEARSFGRYYFNSPGGIQDRYDTLRQSLRIAQSVIERGRSIGGNGEESATRCVGRFLIRESVMEEIARDEELGDRVEVVIPTSMNIHNEQVWLAMLALNHPGRRSILPQEEMIRQVNLDREYPHQSPLAQIMNLQSEGYTFIDQLDGRSDEVAALWGPAFDWTTEGVVSRARTIESQRLLRPEDRASWFAGLVNPEGRLVAAAVAERLDMPTGFSGPLPIIELSEWRRVDDAGRSGLMAADNAYLIAQVLHDLSMSHIRPVLFAETNFMSRAHRVGFASGMDVPLFHLGNRGVPQILEQNVAVGDGHLPPGLRDFTVMYVPDVAVRDLYSEGHRVAILGIERAFLGREL